MADGESDRIEANREVTGFCKEAVSLARLLALPVSDEFKNLDLGKLSPSDTPSYTSFSQTNKGSDISL